MIKKEVKPKDLKENSINSYSYESFLNSLIKEDKQFAKDWKKFENLFPNNTILKDNKELFSNTNDYKRINDAIEIDDTGLRQLLLETNELEKEYDFAKVNPYTNLNFSSNEFNNVLKSLENKFEQSRTELDDNNLFDEMNDDKESTTVIKVHNKVILL
ncbi:hypothetical protein [Mycoplasmopsis columbina]|uniref:Uncharacterized protein n=1 Tax=Mycoplasmopsis columbina SF7 TaxID=1037410 RepID=F9UJP7_9BACT|nr:hypothetical protein [Mycoplasmopsis columbina]EGV00428.1 hypothetical protein MCSF7_00481 [Mycoplasmopsis columbina SF7]